MADGSLIEWTDATWNPITGCSVVSAGCKHCYAMRLAGTRMKHHPSRAGLTVDTKTGPVWTGDVRFNSEWIAQPLRWQKPRDIFVCAHGDLFHEAVPDRWIDRVFAVMALAPQHRFQVLTKRADRMRAYLDGLDAEGGIGRVARLCYAMGAIEEASGLKLGGAPFVPHPLPNVWIGVSIEDRDAMLARGPMLAGANAAVRWWSAEPLLGPLGDIPATMLPDWIVVGGESGPGARVMQLEWSRSIRDQCAAAGVPYLHKQNGEWVAASQIGFRGHEHRDWVDIPPQRYMRVGKKIAGRLLDGVEHNGMPA